MTQEIEQGDIVLCTVNKIAGTIVFVNIDNYNKEGSLILSEVAAGRIRNIRDYIVPKKKIVCKVLRINDRGDIHLSLRRVTQKEQKQVMEQFKQEKSYKSILKTVLKDQTEQAIEKIKEKNNLYEFLKKSKENPKELEKIAGKENTKKILEILNTQKEKIISLKKEIKLTSKNPEGLKLIKEILSKKGNAEIKYLSAGNYNIKIEGKNRKDISNDLKKIISEIEKQARKKNLEFSSEEK